MSSPTLSFGTARPYARADFWEERIRMMAWWAKKCGELWRGGGLFSV